MLEKKRSTIYEKFCEEVAGKMADEVAANRELCDLDVVNDINESNQKFRDDIIKYLKDNAVQSYSDADIEKILDNRERVDRKEAEKNDLASNYKEAVEMIIKLVLGSIVLFELMTCYTVFTMQDFFKLGAFHEYDLVLKIVFVVVAFLPVILTPFFINRGGKIKGFLIKASFAVIFAFIIFMLVNNVRLESGLIVLMCLIFYMLLCYRYNEIRNLNKGDSYNIMVLIIAIIALVVGLYSLYIAR
jgi:cation transport ATPase